VAEKHRLEPVALASGREVVDVRRVRGLLVIATLGAIVFPFGGLASAAPGDCPPAASGFVAYPVVGSAGDPAPDPGDDPLWDLLASSAAEEELTLQDLVVLSGSGTLDGLYALVVGGWLGWDRNGDQMICVQRFPAQQQGKPAFFWNVIDNNAQVSG
jgi:hypothetical protein